jgi:hypothetical protein
MMHPLFSVTKKQGILQQGILRLLPNFLYYFISVTQITNCIPGAARHARTAQDMTLINNFLPI